MGSPPRTQSPTSIGKLEDHFATPRLAGSSESVRAPIAISAKLTAMSVSMGALRGALCC